MLRKGSLEFSFSGLKTAIARHVEVSGVPDEQALADLCAGYEGAIVEVLAQKAIEACKVAGIPRLVRAGGVAANRGLRRSKVVEPRRTRRAERVGGSASRKRTSQPILAP